MGKIEPHEILTQLTDYRIDIVSNKVYVYGISFATETQLAKLDNPFMTIDDKMVLAKTLVKIIKKRIEKNGNN